MTRKYDIIIIGGGNAGFGVSAVASEAGKSIAFIEKRDFGGTCPNRGCTPKKFLVAAARALHEIELAPVHGIDVGPATLDWAKLIRREKSLPIDGAEYLITSDEVLSEPDRPGEVVFIGGGVIAMEFSHVYARAGTKVTILEAMPELLPHMEEGAVAALRRESERLGIAVRTGIRVTAVRRAGDRLSVAYSIDGARGPGRSRDQRRRTRGQCAAPGPGGRQRDA